MKIDFKTYLKAALSTYPVVTFLFLMEGFSKVSKKVYDKITPLVPINFITTVSIFHALNRII